MKVIQLLILALSIGVQVGIHVINRQIAQTSVNGNIEEKIEYKQHTNINISNEQIGKFSAYINLAPLQILFFGRYMDIVRQISLINGM